MTGYREHCGQCGAYLATGTDQDTHETWHRQLGEILVNLNTSIENLNTAVLNLRIDLDHEVAYHRPIGGV